MERVFKVKEEMRFDLVDGDGFTIEEDAFVVPKDSIWYFYCKKGEDIPNPVKLINVESNSWIEIDIDVLESKFDEIK